MYDFTLNIRLKFYILLDEEFGGWCDFETKKIKRYLR